MAAHRKSVIRPFSLKVRRQLKFQSNGDAADSNLRSCTTIFVYRAIMSSVWPFLAVDLRIQGSLRSNMLAELLKGGFHGAL